MKRVISIILAVIMVFSITGTSLAVNTENISTVGQVKMATTQNAIDLSNISSVIKPFMVSVAKIMVQVLTSIDGIIDTDEIVKTLKKFISDAEGTSTNVTPKPVTPTDATDTKMTVAQIVAKYNSLVNTAKKEQNLKIRYLEKISGEITDCSAKAMISALNRVLDSSFGDTDVTYSFKNGKTNNGDTPNSVISPLNKTAKLAKDDVTSATCKLSDGKYYIDIKLIKENYVYNGKKVTATPKANQKVTQTANTTNLDVSGMDISNMKITYSGTRLHAEYNSKGKLTKLTIKNPNTMSTESNMDGMTISMTMKMQVNDYWYFTY